MDEAKLRRLRNLKMFKDMSDDEIIAYYANKPPKEPKEPAQTNRSTSDYDKAFKERLTILQKDYGVDMNNSNDAESLRSLVRHLLQAEGVDRQIRDLQVRDHLADEDVRTLKNLGDFQRGIQTTISDLQDKLGITRKLRKEKAVDDIAVWTQDIQKKAKELWERETRPIKCENCSIELARIWVNFPKVPHKINFESECWRCKEKVIYVY